MRVECHHHFKCGNSLVGTRVEDLGGSLFVNYFKGKLPPIIKDIFAIIEKDTITFDDVKAKKAHDQAVENAKLEFKNIADVYVGIRFGEEKSESYLAMLTDPRLARNTSSEFASIYRFFHWQIEFPEVFFNKFGQDLDNAGFDAVIGNPPYVRQEGLGQTFKKYLKSKFAVYSSIADLYVYFFEQANRQLKNQGICGFISSNKFMRANYGQSLRKFLLSQTKLDKIIDFGELPVFDNAATFPAIFLTQKYSAKTQKFLYSAIKHLNFSSLVDVIEKTSNILDDSSLANGTWALTTNNEASILEKIRKVGIPLGKYVNGKIYYGIKTGLNEAFVINQETQDILIKKDPKNIEIIKPFIVGDDVRRYNINYKNKYLIFTRRGIDIEKYPSIEQYLTQFREKLEPKPSNWKGEWNGRKPGSYKWYEIQDTIDYYRIFEKPKIVYPIIAKESRFTIDQNNYYTNDKTFVIPQNDLYLLAILNSKLCWLFLKRLCSVLGDADKGGRLELREVHLNKLPIYPMGFSNPTGKARHDQIVTLVERMLELHKNLATATDKQKPFIQRQINETDKEIDELVYQLYGLTNEEIAIVEAATR